MVCSPRAAPTTFPISTARPDGANIRRGGRRRRRAHIKASEEAGALSASDQLRRLCHKSDYCIRTPDRPSAPMCMFGPRRKRSPCTIMLTCRHAAMPRRMSYAPRPRLRTARSGRGLRILSARPLPCAGRWYRRATCSGVNNYETHIDNDICFIRPCIRAVGLMRVMRRREAPDAPIARFRLSFAFRNRIRFRYAGRPARAGRPSLRTEAAERRLQEVRRPKLQACKNNLRSYTKLRLMRVMS